MTPGPVWIVELELVSVVGQRKRFQFRHRLVVITAVFVGIVFALIGCTTRSKLTLLSNDFRRLLLVAAAANCRRDGRRGR